MDLPFLKEFKNLSFQIHKMQVLGFLAHNKSKTTQSIESKKSYKQYKTQYICIQVPNS